MENLRKEKRKKKKEKEVKIGAKFDSRLFFWRGGTLGTDFFWLPTPHTMQFCVVLVHQEAGSYLIMDLIWGSCLQIVHSPYIEVLSFSNLASRKKQNLSSM